MKRKSPQAAVEAITSRIVIVRGQRVMLDADLALLYGVGTKRFNEQVRRNTARFPSDFMFRLTRQEVTVLRSQIATSNDEPRHGGRRHLPLAFTEHGALMAANVLNSTRAAQVAIFIVRAFVALRESLAAHEDLVKRLDELEGHLEKKLATHDQAIAGILSSIRQLMATPRSKQRPIGFVTTDKNEEAQSVAPESISTRPQ